MTFRIRGLDPAPFIELYGLSDTELLARSARRMIADTIPGFPDRIEMRDAELGEAVLLVNFEHLPVDSPYRSSHAIFVREGASEAFVAIDQVPDVMARRQLSVRAFDDAGMMIDARLIDGADAAVTFAALLGNPAAAYLHVHNAVRGCYSGLVERA